MFVHDCLSLYSLPQQENNGRREVHLFQEIGYAVNIVGGADP